MLLYSSFAKGKQTNRRTNKDLCVYWEISTPFTVVIVTMWLWNFNFGTTYSSERPASLWLRSSFAERTMGGFTNSNQNAVQRGRYIHPSESMMNRPRSCNSRRLVEASLTRVAMIRSSSPLYVEKANAVDTRLKICILCAKKSHHRCLRCRIPYCSKDCQKKNWSDHKNICTVIAAHQALF